MNYTTDHKEMPTAALKGDKLRHVLLNVKEELNKIITPSESKHLGQVGKY